MAILEESIRIILANLIFALIYFGMLSWIAKAIHVKTDKKSLIRVSGFSGAVALVLSLLGFYITPYLSSALLSIYDILMALVVFGAMIYLAMRFFKLKLWESFKLNFISVLLIYVIGFILGLILWWVV
jgi:hypothetical protein